MLIWFTIRQFSLIAMMPDTKKTVQFRMYKISTARDCSNLVFRFYWERKTLLTGRNSMPFFPIKNTQSFFLYNYEFFRTDSLKIKILFSKIC